MFELPAAVQLDRAVAERKLDSWIAKAKWIDTARSPTRNNRSRRCSGRSEGNGWRSPNNIARASNRYVRSTNAPNNVSIGKLIGEASMTLNWIRRWISKRLTSRGTWIINGVPSGNITNPTNHNRRSNNQSYRNSRTRNRKVNGLSNDITTVDASTSTTRDSWCPCCKGN